MGFMDQIRVKSIRQVRDHIADVVDRVECDGTPTVITRGGQQVAAIVSIDFLRRYQRLEEQEIMRVVHERMGNPEPGVPMEQIMAEVLEDPSWAAESS